MNDEKRDTAPATWDMRLMFANENYKNNKDKRIESDEKKF